MAILLDKYYQKTKDGKLILRNVSNEYMPQNITTRIKQEFSSPDAIIIYILDANRQSAVSFAREYPNQEFVFYTEKNIIDGWDLDNVSIKRVSKEEINVIMKTHLYDLIYTDSSILKYRDDRYSLYNIFKKLNKTSKIKILPVKFEITDKNKYIVKGNFCHKEDQVIIVSSNLKMDKNIVYQRYIKNVIQNIQVLAYKNKRNGIFITIMDIKQSAFGREEFFIAGETIKVDYILEKTIESFKVLTDFNGFMSYNWIKDSNNEYYLTSLRPTIKSFFKVFGKFGDWNKINSMEGIYVTDSGIKLATKQNYSSYEFLR